MPSSRLDCPLNLKTPDMGNTGYIESHKYKHENVREALDMVYCEESSELDEPLFRMQLASLEIVDASPRNASLKDPQ